MVLRPPCGNCWLLRLGISVVIRRRGSTVRNSLEDDASTFQASVSDPDERSDDRVRANQGQALTVCPAVDAQVLVPVFGLDFDAIHQQRRVLVTHLAFEPNVFQIETLPLRRPKRTQTVR